MDQELRKSAERIDETAKSVEQAATTVQEAVTRVDTSVSEGIQPDIRELRMFFTELNEKSDIRLRRLFRALLILIGLNVVTLLAVLLT